MTLLCALVTVYIVVLALRAVMSWFPLRPGTPWTAIYGIVCDLTEPVLAPMRRVIPPAGMFDISFLVLFLALAFLRNAICP